MYTVYNNYFGQNIPYAVNIKDLQNLSDLKINQLNPQDLSIMTVKYVQIYKRNDDDLR